MKEIFFYNQKGQSLVEVTVALGILIIVLSAAVTLAAQSVGLMISSRQRTEAVAIAQKSLEILEGDKTNTCDGVKNTGVVAISLSGLITPLSTQFSTSTYEVKDYLGFTGTATGHKEVTVNMKWNSRLGGDTTMTVKQIIKEK